MAKSRYSNVDIVDNHHYKTFRLPVLASGYKSLDLLKNVRTIEYTYVVGDRLDKLAAKFFNGEDQYWWVIALVNNISYPFASGGLTPGRLLQIPINVKDVLDKLFR